ncbi:unnamed protein product [Meloidogyne enterolobii]|uniref:Uncharacterized protein n=1 Tax=Meloidogyne enterolobii TaxID=390850 RepID=A0ACB0XW95_MELEN
MSNNPNDKFAIISVESKPFAGQKPGTSGLRKKVPEFQQQHYTENFIQCVLDGGLGVNKRGSILVVGGDGRFLCAQAVSKLIIGRDGILSGIILTASHNPGGPKNDFGIKFNCENGGPAPDNVTERIYELTTKISKYYICPELNIDFGEIGTSTVNIQDLGPFTIQVIDSIRSFISETSGDGRKFSIIVDSMHGVTGPYVSNIFVDRLGAQSNCCLRTHPDPNLTYAKCLVDKMSEGKIDIGAAFDGDGGAFFVTPSDSLAIIAANLDCIPYFKKTGIKGYARSMPTACAVDKVAKSLGRDCYEVPTGWKYFGNLMDAGKLSLCGEESFGTGSDHIREKDGIWAFLAWLQILAAKRQSVEDIVVGHWKEFGRNVYTRYY